MISYAIALDIGTSGLRAQALDIETGATVATAITQRHPIPGMNVIDHVNFAIKNGQEQATSLLREAANNLFATLGIDLSKVKRIGVCGNTFQMSLFEGIEIRDLAYAGKKMLDTLGIKNVERNGSVHPASELGIKGMPDAEVIIPPAVTHEIGGDAIAMLKMTDVLEEKEPVIVVDYGTNAEMALIHEGRIFTGSAAAGPAMEGQQIEKGMLAAPGAISDVRIVDGGWQCTVLDEGMSPVDGDIVDPATGEVVKKGNIKAIGVTGTGVVATLYCGIKAGLINTPKILSADGMIHLQDGVCITSKDVEEAGKAIGALRAGFLTLMDAAGIWCKDLKKAYLSGASGLYVDAVKALNIGMVVPSATHMVQFGNTSIEMARRMALGKIDLDMLREFAKELRATHVMFATSDFFKNLYGVEYSVWCTGLPMEQYNDMLGIYSIPPICDPESDPKVERLAKTDLPETENISIKTLEDCGTVLVGTLEGCISCSKCINACPENAITLTKGPEGVECRIRTDLCGGSSCKRCERACKSKVMKHDKLKLA